MFKTFHAMKLFYYSILFLSLHLGFPKIHAALINHGFEGTKEGPLAGWQCASIQPPTRSDKVSHKGSFSIHSKLVNKGPFPTEGHLIQVVEKGIVEGEKYALSFWIKEVDFGVSYVQETMVSWLSETGEPLGGTGLKPFKGKSEWTRISINDLIAPAGAQGVKLMFRFVTGAVEGGSGEIFLDDVAFERSDYEKEYHAFLKANPAVAQAIEKGLISKEKVLEGVKSQEKERERH